MKVQELLQIIKKEKLYKYHIFQIGPPRDTANIGTYVNGAEIYGIYEISSDIWREYTVGERGGITYTSENLTESEACEALLKDLRIDRDSITAFHWPKPHHTLKHPEKWFD